MRYLHLAALTLGDSACSTGASLAAAVNFSPPPSPPPPPTQAQKPPPAGTVTPARLNSRRANSVWKRGSAACASSPSMPLPALTSRLPSVACTGLPRPAAASLSRAEPSQGPRRACPAAARPATPGSAGSAPRAGSGPGGPIRVVGVGAGVVAGGGAVAEGGEEAQGELAAAGLGHSDVLRRITRAGSQ